MRNKQKNYLKGTLEFLFLRIIRLRDEAIFSGKYHVIQLHENILQSQLLCRKTVLLTLRGNHISNVYFSHSLYIPILYWTHPERQNNVLKIATL